MSCNRPYIQITTRCNMKCAHCCFSCTEQGKDMTFKTFKKTLKTLNSKTIEIGGGEPTIHPLFFNFVKYAIDNKYNVGVTTNGKEKDAALELFNKFSLYGRLLVSLSLDKYHENISDDVVNKYGQYGRLNKDADSFVIATGRAKENRLSQLYPNKILSTIVRPSGKIEDFYGTASYDYDEFKLRKENKWEKTIPVDNIKIGTTI